MIAVASGMTGFYLVCVLLDMPSAWIFALCLSSMAATGWMAVGILKDPWSTDKTFDEYFYQDREDIRRKWTPCSGGN